MKQVFTFLFLFLSVLIFAEGMHIRGVITDADSKKPVKDAFIKISFFKGFEFSDKTDSLGRYDITTTAVVPEGYYGLEIDAKGYYQPNGFVHVTKDCLFNFTLKHKTTKPAEVVTAKNEVNSVKKDTVTILVGVPDAPKTVLDGYATNNLVFLIDISSSMNTPERMPLLKESMKYLVSELRTTDKVAILTFSNFVKEVLPSTPASNKELIYKTIDGLSFGSTSQGGAALETAYKTAQKNILKKGNNRIVLASDGIFTSGEKDYIKMQETIESGLQKNITLSIFCFGKNTEYVKTKLKKLTTAGKGNFANIISLEEAKKHMLEEAKAVKD